MRNVWLWTGTHTFLISSPLIVLCPDSWSGKMSSAWDKLKEERSAHTCSSPYEPCLSCTTSSSSSCLSSYSLWSLLQQRAIAPLPAAVSAAAPQAYPVWVPLTQTLGLLPQELLKNMSNVTILQREALISFLKNILFTVDQSRTQTVSHVQ